LVAASGVMSDQIAEGNLIQVIKASSSIGRAAVSKTAGWGFDSLLACHDQESMTTSVDTKVQDAGGADTAKLVVAVVLVAGGVAGYYVLGNEAVWIRWLAVAAGIALGALVIAFSKYGTALKQFVADSRVELRKIVWPNKNETGTTTLVVFVFLIIAGVFFWGLDLALAWATKVLTGQGG
jgi:preprotein translocase subunit SecE